MAILNVGTSLGRINGVSRCYIEVGHKHSLFKRSRREKELGPCEGFQTFNLGKLNSKTGYALYLMDGRMRRL